MAPTLTNEASEAAATSLSFISCLELRQILPGPWQAVFFHTVQNLEGEAHAPVGQCTFPRMPSSTASRDRVLDIFLSLIDLLLKRWKINGH